MSDIDEGGETTPRSVTRVRFDALLERLPGVQELREHQATRLLLAGVAIGVVAGVAAGGFDRAIVLISELLLGSAEPSIDSPELWRRLLGPILTGLLAAALVVSATRRHRAQGVPDVLARVQMREHPLSLRDGLLSATGAALVVGGGQSGGREGPIVQLASTLATKVVRWMGIAPQHARALVAAGGAAGVAASFNTPIGGAFFALEIILGNFAMETFAPVIAATVTGTVVGQFLLGDRIALQLPPFTVENAWELVFYALLGGACGAVGALFKRSIFLADELMNRVAVPRALRGGAAGLVVGLIAVLGMSAVMGNGYAFMEALISHPDHYGVALLGLLLVAKLVATAATASGRSGAGLFAPSLFVGAVLGTLLGQAFDGVFPGIVSDPGAYGMVGMAALAAATLHAPITMTLMMFEMTRNYAVILPLLTAVATASIVSRNLNRESIYEAELRRQGIELPRGREELVMHDLAVGDIMREEEFETVRAGAPTGEIVARFLARRAHAVFVLNADDTFAGIIDIQDAKRYFGHPEAAAQSMQPRRITTLAPDQRLSDAIGAFFSAPVDELPVVSADGRLVGVLAERDVVAAYNREVLRQAVPLTRVVQEGPAGPRTDFLELPPGEALEVVPVAPWMVGKTLRELGLPRQFECSVLAIRVPSEDGGPAQRRPALPETRLGEGDELVVIGPVEGLAALEASTDGQRPRAVDEPPAPAPQLSTEPPTQEN